MALGSKGTMFVGTFDKGTVHAVVDQGGKKVDEALHHRPAHADRRRLPGQRALRRRHRQALQVRRPRSQSRQGAAGQGRLRRLPALRAARLEIPGARRQGVVLHPRRRALQHLPAADQHGAVSPGQSRQRHRRAGGARRAQQRRRRRRSAHRRPVVQRECARLAERRDAERQAQPRHAAGRAFRLSVLPSGRHAGSQVRHGAQVLRVHAASGQARRARRAARHEVLYRQPVPGRVQERHLHRRARLVEPHKKSGYRIVFISVDPTARTRRRRCSPSGGWLDGEKIVAVPPTSWRRPTAPCWWPTIRPARSTRSATRSSRSQLPPAATPRAGRHSLSSRAPCPPNRVSCLRARSVLLLAFRGRRRPIRRPSRRRSPRPAWPAMARRAYRRRWRVRRRWRASRTSSSSISWCSCATACASRRHEGGGQDPHRREYP